MDSLTSFEPLTERETEVLYAMADGLSNQEISNTLFIALATVKWYNSQIYSKLGVNNRQEAVKQARLLGLLDTDNQILPDVPNNLFQPTTPFIGRYKELSELDALLQNPEVRLITILAPGGMGKTRLLLHIAQHQLRKFPDGVFLTELAPLTTAEAIAPNLVEVLQLDGYDNALSSTEVLQKYLANRCFLLVLDNFEHLLEGATLINDILQAAPQVKILVSSRERLNLQSENIFVLNGLSTPQLDSENPIDYDAVRLFVDGAKRIRPDYEVNDADLAHVLEICTLVGGMPLGIELAAGWMDVLSPTKIVEELRNGIHILETDMRDIPERHRSMRATFDRSWQRLTEAEQEAMMHLAIFRGGFSQDAATEVVQASLLTLRRLVSKSLLFMDAQGRYHIHELLRQYCAEKLSNSAQQNLIQDQHALYYADYLEGMREGFINYHAGIHKQINIELDNLIMAWKHFVANGDFISLKKCMPFMNYLASYNKNTWAVDLLQLVIDRIQVLMQDKPELRRLYIYFSVERSDFLSYVSGDKDNKIKAHFQEMIDLAEAHGYDEEMVRACCAMATPLVWTSEYSEKIEDYLTKALRVSEANNDKEWKIWILVLLASNSFNTGDRETAWQYLQQVEILKKSYQLNYFFNIWTQLILVDVYIEAEKYAEAEDILDSAIERVERSEHIYAISMCRNYKAQIAFKRNDISEAKKQIAAIIHWHRLLAHDWQILGTLWGNYVAWFLIQVGEDEQAVEVASFVLHHPHAVQLHRDGSEKSLATLYRRMDENVFNEAFERGKDMKLDDVVTNAIAFLTTA